jgi:hypothetical protein
MKTTNEKLIFFRLREIMSRLMLVFFARADQEGMERAIPYIERIVQLPFSSLNSTNLSSQSFGLL